MLDQPEAVSAITMLADMILVDGCMPDAAASGDATGGTFASGRVAMEVNGCWSFENMQGTAEIDWDIAPLPLGPAGRGTRAWSDSICISVDSRYVEESWSFIKYLVGEKGQTVETLSSTRIPVYIPNSLREEFLSPAAGPEHKRVIVDMLPESDPLVFRANWGEWFGVMANELYPAYTGEMTPEEAAQSAARAINVILDEYNAG